MKDWQLLQQWVEHRSETAFAQLVDRHIDFVHNCARRQVGDPSLAQDVTQAVFLLLSRKASSFGQTVILTSWLFRTTRFIATRAQRAEYRRLRLESSSAAMQPLLDDSSTSETEVRWSDLEPHLDTAIADLPGADRDAILLRFFERKPLRDVGLALGVSEEAAKKRVTRAVMKLREGLASRGLALSFLALGALLADVRLQAAPNGLAGTVANLAAGGVATPPTLDALVQGGSRDWFWNSARTWIPAAIGAVALFIATVSLLPNFHREPAPAAQTPPPTSAASSLTSAVPPTDRSGFSSAKRSSSALRLQVVDAATGSPLGGTRVRLSVWGPSGGPPAEERQTDPTGALQIDLSPNSFETLGVTIAHAGYVPVLAEWHAHEFVTPTLDHTCRLKRGQVVRGDVRDAAGNPVPNAKVCLAGFWSFEPSLRENLGFNDSFTAFFTDANGHFETGQVPNPLPPAGGFILSVTHPEFVRGTIEVQNIDQLATNQFIVLKPGIRLSGRVVDDKGNPIEGANVEENHHHIGSRRSTQTDASGGFVLGPFAPGALPIEVSAAGFKSVEQDIVVDTPTARLEWTLERLATDSTTSSTFDSPRVRLAGSVVDATTGMPLPEFKVTMALFPDGNLCRLMGVGHEGRFGWEVSADSRALVSLRVEADGYASAESGSFDPTRAQDPMEFRLHRVPRVRGRILQPDGQPAAGAEVGMNGDGYGLSFELPARFVNYGPVTPHFIADSQGVFGFNPASNPRMVLFLHHSGCLALPVESVTNVLVRLEPWGSLDGTLQIAGKPAANETVQIARLMPDPLHPPMGVHLTQPTDANGRFSFERLPPGQYVVSRLIDLHPGREGETGQSHEARVDVRPNTRGSVVLGTEGRPVIARLKTSVPVADLDWTPVLPRLVRNSVQPAPIRSDYPNAAAFQRASALHESALSKHYGTVTPDGVFRAEDVPAGEYTFHVVVFKPTSSEATGSSESWPTQGILGIVNQRVIIPGEPGQRSDVPIDLGEIVIMVR